MDFLKDNDKLVDLERQLWETISELEGLCGESYAEKMATYENLDENKKTVLAAEYTSQDPKLTSKEREMVALSSDAYTSHLVALNAAYMRRKIVDTRKDILYRKLDVLTVLINDERARMKL